MERSREIFEQFKSGKYAYVQSLLGNQPEDEYLDFKRLTSPKLSDEDKKNLSKCISAFANNSGGVLVWGVDARQIEGKGPDVAQEIVAIEGLIAFHSLLLTVAPHMSSGPVVNIEYEKIELSEGSDRGCLVLHIPATETEPIMATASGLHRYYIRNGGTSSMMSHVQIGDMNQSDDELFVQAPADWFIHPGTVRWLTRYQAAWPTAGFIPTMEVNCEVLCDGASKDCRVEIDNLKFKTSLYSKLLGEN